MGWTLLKCDKFTGRNYQLMDKGNPLWWSNFLQGKTYDLDWRATDITWHEGVHLPMVFETRKSAYYVWNAYVKAMKDRGYEEDVAYCFPKVREYLR